MEVTAFECGVPVRYTDTDGDIWNTTWADDGHLYTYANDTRKFGGLDYGAHNLAFGRLEGDDPMHLKQVLINTFPEYRNKKPVNWKSSGLICIDGVLYLTIMKHVWEPDPDQGNVYYQVRDASIIKSTDRGKTWTRSYEDNRDRPMFPGRPFSSPWFIQYGQNYTETDVENLADEFIYAISTDGYYDSGNHWILGRVARSRIDRLDGGDWEYYCGGGADGKLPASWTPNMKDATPIIEDRGQVCKTGVQYVRGIRKYVMIQWYYKRPYVPVEKHCSDTSHWSLWQADTPWGPWKRVSGVHTYTTEGLYCPSICPKFMSRDGREVFVFATGNWDQANKLGLRSGKDNPYALWVVPLRFSTESGGTDGVGVFRDGGMFVIKNAASGKVLAVDGEGVVRCVDRSDKDSTILWKIDYLGRGDSYFSIINRGTGGALEVTGSDSGAQLRTGEPSDSYSQRWFIQFHGNGTYWLSSMYNRYRTTDLFVSWRSVGSGGNNVYQSNAFSSDATKWIIEEQTEGQ